MTLGERKVFMFALLFLVLSGISSCKQEPENHSRGNKEQQMPTNGKTPDKIQTLEATGGVKFALLGRKPPAPTPTVFCFGAADDMLTTPELRFLSERGYLCVSLDLPGHGGNRKHGEAKGLVAWRHRIEAKEDFVTEFHQKIAKVLDYLIAHGYTDPNRVAIIGSSRGAFIGYHYAASDPRVKCVAGLAPVTELEVPREFAGMDKDPMCRSLAVINRAKQFGPQKLLVIIGDQDERVGTDRAIAFARQVSKVALKANVELHVLHEPLGHTIPKGTWELTEAWITKNFDHEK